MTNDKENPCLKRLDADCFRAQPAWAKQALAYRLLRCLAPGQITRRLPKGLRLALLMPGIPLPPGIHIPPLVDTPPVLPPGVPGTGPASPIYVAPWEPGPLGGLGGTSPTAAEVELAIRGSTTDGRITKSDATWTIARNSAQGGSSSTAIQYYNLAMQARFQLGSFRVTRSFLYFDLSSIPSGKSIVSAVVAVIGYQHANTQVSIQEGTQAAALTVADFQAFTGLPFSTITWKKYVSPDLNTNLFDLNSAGKTYVKSKFGETAKFCLREYTKDYLNVQPATSGPANGMYYANYTMAYMRPKITIIYK